MVSIAFPRKKPLRWYMVKMTIVLAIMAVLYCWVHGPSLHNVESTPITGVTPVQPVLDNIPSFDVSLHEKSTLNAPGQRHPLNHFSSRGVVHSRLHQVQSNYPPGSNSTRANSMHAPLKGDDDDDDNTPICHRLPSYPYNKCDYAKSNCISPLAGGILNYLHIRYCTLKYWPLFYPIMGVWIFVLFYLLGDTAESYFCPSLTEISGILKLSPDVSGVTLLAFGNGAPDIASIIAGVVGGSAGFGLGEPIGAGLFVTTAVMSAVTLFSPVKVKPVPFIRDVGTCLIGVSFCFIVYLTGEFKLWQSLFCLALYIFYVFIVIIGKYVYNGAIYVQRKVRQQKQTEEKETLLGSSVNTYGNADSGGRWKPDKKPLWDVIVSRDSDSIHTHHDEHLFYASHYFPKVGITYQTSPDASPKLVHVDDLYNVSKRSRKGRPHFTETVIEDSDDSEDGAANGDILEDGDESHISSSQKQSMSQSESQSESCSESHSDTDFEHSEQHSQSKKHVDLEALQRKGSIIVRDHFAPENHIENDDDVIESLPIHKRVVAELRQWTGWDNMSITDRIQFIFNSPWILIRNLTIPKADKEEWSKFFAVLCPIFIPWFSLSVIGYPLFMVGPIPLGMILTVIGVVFSILVLITSERRKAPIYHPIFVVGSFAMGIIWIYMVANELVDVLQSIGILWQVSDAILAVTVLTWGNSLGDMVADVVVARSGFPDMACAAIYGGPTLNLLIGIGLSVSYHCISEDGAFPLASEPTVLLSFVMFIGSLVSSLIVIPLSGFRSPKHYGIFLMALYVFFMICAALMEVGILFPIIK